MLPDMASVSKVATFSLQTSARGLNRGNVEAFSTCKEIQRDDFVQSNGGAGC